MIYLFLEFHTYFKMLPHFQFLFWIFINNYKIDLPPLIEDETRRKRISTTVKKTRRLYRQFRSNLSKEIRQSYVLPKDIQLRLLKELDKRLDLDVDELLESPKLKVKLSPAELDRQLLEFYINKSSYLA